MLRQLLDIGGCVFMSKIEEALKGKKAFIGFLTAGDPSPELTVEYILEMERAGADLIEIGIPFSDPTAEGVVIQEANIRALSKGMTTEGVFEIVKKVREESQIPLIFLTYANPVFHYGYEKFFHRCEEVGMDGILIPDMPYEERMEMVPFAKKYGIDVISLVAPTSKQRIQMIAKEAEGFVYIVSSMGVTGMRGEIDTDISSIVDAIREVSKVPCAIGFGIHTSKQAKKMAEIADGVIVGSALVKLMETYKDKAHKEIYEYISKIKQAILSE